MSQNIYKLSDLMTLWDDTAAELYDARQGNKPAGVCTGLDGLDDLINGRLAPGLHSLQGGPGIGKTAFALQLACDCGYPAVFVTCEMSPLELFRRVVARTTKTFLGRLKTGELHPAEMSNLAQRAASRAGDLTIIDATREFVPAFATSSQDYGIDSIANGVRADSHCLVVVDSLHSWADRGAGEANEYEYLNCAISSLQALASTLVAPVLVIAERNRMSMAKGGLSGGAGTRKIEYSAESVIELDAQSDPNLNGETTVTLRLSKNRNGESNKSIELRFHGATQTYRGEI